MKTGRRISLGAALVAACAGATGVAQAGPLFNPQTDPGETFQPFVYSNVTYDSNLFRVSGEDEAEALNGTDQMSDTITRVGVGLNIEKPISLQTLRFDGWLERVHYSNFDSLNNTAAHALGAWDWEVARLLDGTLSQSYDRTLSSFEQFNQQTKDLKTVYTTYADGALHVTPDWDVILGGRWREQNNDERDFLDRSESTVFTELRYLTAVNSHVGLRLETTQGDLQDRETTDGVINNDYRQNRYSLVVGWEATTISRLQARVGLTQRQYDERSDRDFSGITGRVDYDWLATPITTIRFSAWHDVSSFGGDIATYVVSDGLSVEPMWEVRPDVTLRLRLAGERNDFQGGDIGPLPADIQADREDKVYSARIGIGYQPILPLNLTLAFQALKRDSNVEQAEYRTNLIMAGAEYAF